MAKNFKGWGAKEWIEYYDSLNAEVPVEKYRFPLTDSEKEAYVSALNRLKEERKTFPKASYEVKYSWFE